MDKRTDIWKIILIVVIAFALLNIYLIENHETLPTQGDSSAYFFLAHQVLNGTFHENSCIFSIRLAEIAPVTLFSYLFGFNALSGELWTTVSYVGLIIVCFYMGKELMDERAGAMAALLISVFPVIEIASHSLDTRLTVAFFAALGMLFLIYGEKKKGKWFFFAAGISFAIAPLVDAYGAVVFFGLFVYLIYCYYNRKLDSSYLYLLYGLLLVLAILLPVNYALSGNPFIIFQLTNGYYDYQGNNSGYSVVNISQCGGSVQYYGVNNTVPYLDTNMLLYLNLMFPHPVAFTSVGAILTSAFYNINFSGIFYYAFFGCVIYMLLSKQKRIYFPLVWFIALLIYLEIGAMHISLVPFQYVIISRAPGFMEMLAAPIVVVIGASLSYFLRTPKKPDKNRKLKFVFVAIILLLLVLFSIYPDIFIPLVTG